MLDSLSIVRTSATVLLAVSVIGAPVWGSQALEPTTDDATVWLQRYVSIDSSTVKGASESGTYLREILHRAGVATKWIISPKGQPFLYAKVEGSSPEAPTLVLMHHLDVIPAGSDWTHPPFAAEVDDGALYGRGTIDDKSLGIAHLVAFLRYRVAESLPSSSLVYLAVGGEEEGGVDGTQWLVENHPDLFENLAGVLTEGGTNRLYGETLAWWGIEVAQKRPLWMLVTTEGRGGHGSSLNLHSAPHRMIRSLSKVVDRPLDFRLTAESRLFFETLAPLESPAFRHVVGNLDSILSGPDPALGLLPGMPNYLLDSIQVNVLEAGSELNVTPPSAQARIDARLLPDTDEEALLAQIQELMGTDAQIEVLLSAPPSPPSPVDHSVYRCLESELGETAPVVPAFITAITDARFLRQRGVPVYGFSPFSLGSKALRGIHSRDEHIPLDVFAEGVETMWNVVRKCATD